MSFFESLKTLAISALKKASKKAVDNALQNIGKGRNYTEKFIFIDLEDRKIIFKNIFNQ